MQSSEHLPDLTLRSEQRSIPFPLNCSLTRLATAARSRMSGPFASKSGRISFKPTSSPSRTLSPIFRISFLIPFSLDLSISYSHWPAPDEAGIADHQE